MATAIFPPTLTPTHTPKPTQTPAPTLATEFTGRFVAVKPSAQDEVNRIWESLKQIAWYDQNGYKPVFPDDPAVATLIQKAREKKLENQDYESLSRLVQGKSYNPDDYEKGYQKVIASFKTVEQVLPTFQKYAAKWDFKMFPTYTVRLTMYGMGGSYDPQKGDLILLTTREGTFSRGADPSDTIMHEAVHLGIEANLIQKYALDQRVKERIVDKFMYDHFLSLVPGYRIQSVGDPAIDEYLTGAAAWDDLPERIKKYKSTK